MKSVISQRFINSFISLIFVVTIISTGFITISNDYKICALMPFLPLMFLFLFTVLVAKKRSSFSSIVTLVIISGYFVRMILCPLLLSTSEYTTEIRNNSAFNYMNEAVLLLSFEFLIVILFMFSSKNITRLNHTPNITKFNVERLHPVVYICLIGIFLFFFVCVFFLSQDYLMYFKGIIQVFQATDAERILRNNAFSEFRNSSSRIIYQFYSQAMYFGQVFLPAYLLYIYTNIFINGQQKSKSKYRGVVVCLAIVLLSFSIITEDYAKSIYIAAAVVITVWFSYPEKLKKIIPILIVIGAVLSFSTLLIKAHLFSSENFGLSDLSKLINAYFASPSNISCGLATVYYDKLYILWGDITRSVPLLAHFFVDLPRSQDLFNATLYGLYGWTDQIMPAICYGYKYLSILAPLPILLLYNLAYKYEMRFKASVSIFNKTIYAFLMISFSIYPSMYMLTSCFTLYMYSIVFTWLIKLNEI